MLKPLRLAEAVLWIAGSAGLLTVATGAVEARAARQQARDLGPSLPPTARPAPERVTGRLEIDAIGLSVPLLENYDPATLTRGVGHIPGTAVAGGLGNMVLAGHRDTFFRPLRHVRPGMTISVVTREGTYRYRVSSTEVVSPDAVRVLDIGERPSMTLITCYPFDFIGAAPQRFIVNAFLVSDPS